MVRTRYLHLALAASNADIALVMGNVDIALVDMCIVAKYIVRDQRLGAVIHTDS